MTEPHTPTHGEPFFLIGGPEDGRLMFVEQCEHHNWPDLIPTDEEHTSFDGCYRYDLERDTYVWGPR